MGDREWEFNCPQYVDFNQIIDLTGDSDTDDFFDVNHESIASKDSSSPNEDVTVQEEIGEDVNHESIASQDSSSPNEDVTVQEEIGEDLSHEAVAGSSSETPNSDVGDMRAQNEIDNVPTSQSTARRYSLSAPTSQSNARRYSIASEGNGHRRKILSVQDLNGGQRKPLRLTPFRQKHSSIYQPAFAVGVEPDSSGKENTAGKTYSLRLTPARKKHTQSCYTYRNVFLQQEKQDLRKLKMPHYDEDGSAVPGPSVSAVPGPSVSAVPGPSVSAVPGPSMITIPGRSKPNMEKFLPRREAVAKRPRMNTEEQEGPLAKKPYHVKTSSSVQVSKTGGREAKKSAFLKAVKPPVSTTSKVKPFQLRSERKSRERSSKELEVPPRQEAAKVASQKLKRKSTKPMPFHFETAARAEKTASKGDEDGPPSKRWCLRSGVPKPQQVKANDLPQSTHTNVVLPKTTQGHRVARLSVKSGETASSSKATSKVARGPKSAKSLTVLEPFSFDAKDQERAQLKMRKISEEKEKQKPVFHFKAQQAPAVAGPSGIPSKAVKPATKPEPFVFKTKQVAMRKVDKWQRDVRKELDRQRQSALAEGPRVILKKATSSQSEKPEKPPEGEKDGEPQDAGTSEDQSSNQKKGKEHMPKEKIYPSVVLHRV